MHHGIFDLFREDKEREQGNETIMLLLPLYHAFTGNSDLYLLTLNRQSYGLLIIPTIYVFDSITFIKTSVLGRGILNV